MQVLPLFRKALELIRCCRIDWKSKFWYNSSKMNCLEQGNALCPVAVRQWGGHHG